MSAASRPPPRGVSVVVDEPSSYFSVQPVVRRLKAHGRAVFVYVPPADVEAAAAWFPEAERVAAATVRGARAVVMARVDFYLRQLLTGRRYSNLYRAYNRFVIAGQPTPRRLAGALLARLPGCPRRRINTVYTALWAPAHRRPVFATRTVLAVSRCHRPYLLAPRWHDVHLLVDSWDHPVKAPFFARPRRVYVWNRDLARDVRTHQGVGDGVRTVFPFKFRYLLPSERRADDVVRSDRLRRELARIDAHRRDYYLYVCTGSSLVRGGRYFDGERRLIAALAREAGRRGRRLFVKPYPFYDPREFDFLRGLPAVHVCPGEIPGGRRFQSAFSDEQLHYKVRLIEGARATINVATTLVLEAALVNPAVAQIRIEDDVFGRFGKWSRNHHVRTYLNASPHALGCNRRTLPAVMERIFGDDPALSRFGAGLRAWLTARTYPDSVAAVVADLTAGPAQWSRGP